MFNITGVKLLEDEVICDHGKWRVLSVRSRESFVFIITEISLPRCYDPCFEVETAAALLTLLRCYH